jgi:hypothetical protein
MARERSDAHILDLFCVISWAADVLCAFLAFNPASSEICIAVRGAHATLNRERERERERERLHLTPVGQGDPSLILCTSRDAGLGMSACPGVFSVPQ